MVGFISLYQLVPKNNEPIITRRSKGALIDENVKKIKLGAQILRVHPQILKQMSFTIQRENIYKFKTKITKIIKINLKNKRKFPNIILFPFFIYRRIEDKKWKNHKKCALQT